MSEPIKEALLEFLRVIVLAVIPVAISSIESGIIDLKLIATVAAIAGLRFIDKALHLRGKELDNKTLTAGLTRF